MDTFVRVDRVSWVPQIVLLEKSRLESDGDLIIHLVEQGGGGVHVELGIEKRLSPFNHLSRITEIADLDC